VHSLDSEVRSSILRVRGLVAADLTQLIAFCGFFSLFFFATLYMQEVLRYSPLKAGAAYLPITAGFAVGGGVASQLVTRIGTRTVVVAGCLIAASGIYWVSRVPLHGSYVTDLLRGFVVMSLGAGSVFVAVTAAANAGVAADKAGLAAGLLNSSQQVGSALGLAILSAVAITRTSNLIASGAPHLAASDGGYHIALLVGSTVMAAAAPIVMVSADATSQPQPERASAPAANGAPAADGAPPADGAARARPPRYRE
jgi:predicted MFS family arabinose efflux permease